jgi:GNAT superfamily N-acetyltransferase
VPYAITAADPDAAYEPILARLLAFNAQVMGEAGGTPFALAIREPDSDEVLGGLWALSLWGSFYIALMVTPDGARGQGLGTDLMAQAEAEAIRQGCREIWLDTFAFQARPFYERLGFTVFGQLDGPPPAFPRWFMKKPLPPAN